jgi:hypothetical protein
MKRILIVAAMMCCTIPAFSQAPKAEFFGGYSFARQGSANLNAGWTASVTGNFKRWFGIEGDVNGQYWREDMSTVSGGSLVVATSKLDILSYRIGPSSHSASRTVPSPRLCMCCLAAPIRQPVVQPLRAESLFPRPKGRTASRASPAAASTLAKAPLPFAGKWTTASST